MRAGNLIASLKKRIYVQERIIESPLIPMVLLEAIDLTLLESKYFSEMILVKGKLVCQH